MVIPLALAGASLVPFALNVGSKISKFHARFPQSLRQSTQFGLGYGASTAVGYNLVPQWNRQNYNKKSEYNLSSMYGNRSYYRRRRYSSRYGSRYGSRYSRYGRTYGSRYPRYYRRRY